MSAYSFLQRQIKTSLLLSMLPLGMALPSRAETYTPVPGHRVDISLNSGWRFIRQDVAGAESQGFVDSSWSAVTLPHTWNNLDGQDGGSNYYRGIGWYRQHYEIDNRYVGRQFFLKFDGSCYVTDVYLNGTHLGQHQGGFAAFAFDATPYMKLGADNIIAVKVSNASNTNVPPLSADFTFFGGLYRDAHLLITDPVHISPLDYGSPGVYLKTTEVDPAAAHLQITAVASNATPAAAAVCLRAVITDASGNIVIMLTNSATLAPASSSNVVATTTIVKPHLWDGLSDPYLYRAFVELWNGNNLVDVVVQPLGFRFFKVDPANGFFLNGGHYDLHGVNMHQDWFNCGWALGSAQRQTNFAFLKELGATMLRLSHYEHHDETYQLADRDGLVVWSEIPLVNAITETPAFYANARQQLREMIRQRYNHPSVLFWGIYNEITLRHGPNATELVRQLAQLEAEEDPTRPSVAAANTGDSDPTTFPPQIISFNKYFGWYDRTMEGFGPWADAVHAKYPARPIGVSEYGAGANIYQHSEQPVGKPSPGGSFHPEEYQNLYHESHWQQMKARPFLWCKLVWNLFDFASDGRDEGAAPGRNDKGLVTYDRKVRKDVFYWYKANWASEPMVYITGHTFTNRMTRSIDAKVYANCDSVELFLNGASQGNLTSTNCIFIWRVALAAGSNTVAAVGTKGSLKVTDSLMWLAPSTASTTSPTHPPSASTTLQ